MRPKRLKLASLALKICTLWFQFFGAFFASKGYPLRAYNKTLGFFRQNLSECTSQVKYVAYTTMVRPKLEYSSTVWDPHLTSNVHTLEQVQLRAARFVHRSYTQRTPGCVTNMIQSLGWESLQQRRCMDRLSMLFKIQHGLVDISHEFVQPDDSRTRGSCFLFLLSKPP